MDIQFENRYFSTDQMISQYVRKVICKRLKLVGFTSSAVAFVMLLITLYKNDYIFSAIFGFGFFVTFFTSLLAPVLMLKQFKESHMGLHGGGSFETVVQFHDDISISEGSFSLTVEYRQIRRVHSLKHVYVLMLGRYNGILLSPEHFTLGTFEDFKRFLAEKTPGVKVPL